MATNADSKQMNPINFPPKPGSQLNQLPNAHGSASDPIPDWPLLKHYSENSVYANGSTASTTSSPAKKLPKHYNAKGNGD
jgi:hypothetical protein